MKISASELQSQLESGQTPLLIDVRTRSEFSEQRIPDAMSMPVDKIDPVEVRSKRKQGQTCVTICQSGKRSEQARRQLSEAGVEDVFSLEGGLEQWQREGLPIERSESRRLPIMRQVQVTAGAAVLIGTILTVAVDPWWAILPGFFGAGLTFAGLTGFCGMARLLDKMPWNKA